MTGTDHTETGYQPVDVVGCNRVVNEGYGMDRQVCSRLGRPLPLDLLKWRSRVVTE